MKIKIDPEKAAGWLGAALETGNKLMTGANFTLKQLIQRTASHLDVAESEIRLDFGKTDGQWCWTAKAKVDSWSSASAEDPMHALAALAEKMKP
jgi:hypothetical protein